MKNLLTAVLMCAMAAVFTSCQSHNVTDGRKNVTSENKNNDKAGSNTCLVVPCMYWYGPHFAVESSNLYYYGRITEIYRGYENSYIVRMKLLETIPSPKNKNEFTTLIIDGIKSRKGIKVGDHIITSFVHYENSEAMPAYEGTNCLLGYKLEFDHKGIMSDTSLEFLEMLRRTSSTGKTTSEDYRTWALIDPEGTLDLLLRHLDFLESERNTQQQEQ